MLWLIGWLLIWLSAIGYEEGSAKATAASTPCGIVKLTSEFMAKVDVYELEKSGVVSWLFRDCVWNNMTVRFNLVSSVEQFSVSFHNVTLLQGSLWLTAVMLTRLNIVVENSVFRCNAAAGFMPSMIRSYPELSSDGGYLFGIVAQASLGTVNVSISDSILAVEIPSYDGTAHTAAVLTFFSSGEGRHIETLLVNVSSSLLLADGKNREIGAASHVLSIAGFVTVVDYTLRLFNTTAIANISMSPQATDGWSRAVYNRAAVLRSFVDLTAESVIAAQSRGVASAGAMSLTTSGVLRDVRVALQSKSVIHVNSEEDADAFAWRAPSDIESSQSNAVYIIDEGSHVEVIAGRSATVFTQFAAGDTVSHVVSGFLFALLGGSTVRVVAGATAQVLSWPVAGSATSLRVNNFSVIFAEQSTINVTSGALACLLCCLAPSANLLAPLLLEDVTVAAEGESVVSVTAKTNEASFISVYAKGSGQDGAPSLRLKRVVIRVASSTVEVRAGSVARVVALRTTAVDGAAIVALEDVIWTFRDDAHVVAVSATEVDVMSVYSVGSQKVALSGRNVTWAIVNKTILGVNGTSVRVASWSRMALSTSKSDVALSNFNVSVWQDSDVDIVAFRGSLTAFSFLHETTRAVNLSVHGLTISVEQSVVHGSFGTFACVGALYVNGQRVNVSTSALNVSVSRGADLTVENQRGAWALAVTAPLERKVGACVLSACYVNDVRDAIIVESVDTMTVIVSASSVTISFLQVVWAALALYVAGASPGVVRVQSFLVGYFDGAVLAVGRGEDPQLAFHRSCVIGSTYISFSDAAVDVTVANSVILLAATTPSISIAVTGGNMVMFSLWIVQSNGTASSVRDSSILVGASQRDVASPTTLVTVSAQRSVILFSIGSVMLPQANSSLLVTEGTVLLNQSRLSVAIVISTASDVSVVASVCALTPTGAGGSSISSKIALNASIVVDASDVTCVSPLAKIIVAYTTLPSAHQKVYELVLSSSCTCLASRVTVLCAMVALLTLTSDLQTIGMGTWSSEEGDGAISRVRGAPSIDKSQMIRHTILELNVTDTALVLLAVINPSAGPSYEFPINFEFFVENVTVSTPVALSCNNCPLKVQFGIVAILAGNPPFAVNDTVAFPFRVGRFVAFVRDASIRVSRISVSLLFTVEMIAARQVHPALVNMWVCASDIRSHRKSVIFGIRLDETTHRPDDTISCGVSRLAVEDADECLTSPVAVPGAAPLAGSDKIGGDKAPPALLVVDSVLDCANVGWPATAASPRGIGFNVSDQHGPISRTDAAVPSNSWLQVVASRQDFVAAAGMGLDKQGCFAVQWAFVNRPVVAMSLVIVDALQRFGLDPPAETLTATSTETATLVAATSAVASTTGDDWLTTATTSSTASSSRATNPPSTTASRPSASTVSVSSPSAPTTALQHSSNDNHSTSVTTEAVATTRPAFINVTTATSTVNATADPTSLVVAVTRTLAASSAAQGIVAGAALWPFRANKGTTLSRTRSLMSACSTRDEPPPEPAWEQFVWDGGGQFRGAVVSTACLQLMLLTAGCVASRFVARRRHDGDAPSQTTVTGGSDKPHAFIRFVRASYIATGVYYTPNVAAWSVYLMLSTGTSAPERVAGVFGLAVAAAVTVAMTVGTAASPAAARVQETPQGPQEGLSPASSCQTMISRALRECHSPMVDGLKPSTAARLYVVVDVASAAGIGVVSLLPMITAKVSCLASTVVMTLMFVAQLAYVISVRPFVTRIDMASAVALLVANGAVSAVSSIAIGRAAPEPPTVGDMRLVDQLTLVATCAFFGDLALAIGLNVHHFLSKTRSERSACELSVVTPDEPLLTLAGASGPVPLLKHNPLLPQDGKAN